MAQQEVLKSELAKITEKQRVNRQVLADRHNLEKTLKGYNPAESSHDPLIKDGNPDLQQAAINQARAIVTDEANSPSRLQRNIAYHEGIRDELAAQRTAYHVDHPDELITYAQGHMDSYLQFERLERKAAKGYTTEAVVASARAQLAKDMEIDDVRAGIALLQQRRIAEESGQQIQIAESTQGTPVFDTKTGIDRAPVEGAVAPSGEPKRTPEQEAQRPVGGITRQERRTRTTSPSPEVQAALEQLQQGESVTLSVPPAQRHGIQISIGRRAGALGFSTAVDYDPEKGIMTVNRKAEAQPRREQQKNQAATEASNKSRKPEISPVELPPIPGQDRGVEVTPPSPRARQVLNEVIQAYKEGTTIVTYDDIAERLGTSHQAVRVTWPDVKQTLEDSPYQLRNTSPLPRGMTAQWAFEYVAPQPEQASDATSPAPLEEQAPVILEPPTPPAGVVPVNTEAPSVPVTKTESEKKT